MSKTDAAFAAALCLVVAGVSLIYLPAGLIAAGALLAACAWLYERGGEGA